MRVSIVIPTQNRHELLARCLDSLGRQTLRELEVIVIDNGSEPPVTNPPPAHAESRLIRFERNTGFCYAVNCGITMARGEYVLLLNNDVELEPPYLERLVQALEQEPRAGFATGKLVRALEPGVLDGAGDALLLGGGAYRLGHGEKDRGQLDSPAWVLGACGAAVLYRSSVFEQIGPLDEDFFAYLEDMDIALRAQWAGFGGLYVPQAVAHHHGSATLGPDDPRILNYITRNQLFVLWKNFPAALLLRCAARILVFQILWVLRLLWYGFAPAYLRGLAGAMAALPRMLGRRRQIRSLRKISTGEFLALLRASERAIYDSEQRRPPAERSRLLAWYFGLCGRPAAKPTEMGSAVGQTAKDLLK